MTMDCTVGKYPAAVLLYFLFVGLWCPILASKEGLIKDFPIAEGALGRSATVNCTSMKDNVQIEWLFNGNPLENTTRISHTNSSIALSEPDQDGAKQYKVYKIEIANATKNDAGNYTCLAKLEGNEDSKTALLNLSFAGKLTEMTSSPVKVNFTDHNIHTNVTLYCAFQVYEKAHVRWKRISKDYEDDEILSVSDTVQINPTTFNSSYTILVDSTKYNGTYTCELLDAVTSTYIFGNITILVYDKPQIVINDVIPINTTQVYLSWTVYAHNSPILEYILKYRDLKTDGFQFPNKKVPENSTEWVISELVKSSNYSIDLEVKTNHGSSKVNIKSVVTLAEEPIFVPNISINGFSATSVTIGGGNPPEEIANLIHYYKFEAWKKDEPNATHFYRSHPNLPYMFDNLQPHSTYVFKVCACSNYTKSCGPWSTQLDAATLDGIPGKPDNVYANCSVEHLFMTWEKPQKPNAEIKGYTIEVTGTASFKDRDGKPKQATWGPLSKFMLNDSLSVRVNDLPPNTEFTVRVSAVTRTRRRGEQAIATCSTRAAPPDAAPRPKWRKIADNGTYMFKMYLQRLSERNGPICCYRIHMVRLLQDKDWKTLPSPKDLNILDYNEAHANQPAFGAYITDVFSNDKFPSDSELTLGDGLSLYYKNETRFNNEQCRRCLKRPKRDKVVIAPPPPIMTTTSSTTPLYEEDDVTADPPRVERSITDEDYSKLATMADGEDDTVKVVDGKLDSNANYTLFIEIISEADNGESLYSDYTSALRPAPSPTLPAPTSVLEVTLQITCAVAAVILVLMIIFCVMQTRRSRKMPRHGGTVEMDPVSTIKKYFLGNQAPNVPRELPPISREELASAYLQRQVDSDYHFQKEFEWLQMIPECFANLTTHASEARENQPKNRYPDIKAYDQTRVKLSQVDGITGSDYINANFVRGYQDPKKFICAQGPTDTTVNDFWRMIWEHGLELIVMLTNLEEYSKVKCSKYWPEERGNRAFGGISVQHVGEKRYSDYIVRELKVTKQPVNADGQPIVENNGNAKRNGDINNGLESSAPTSPRETKEVGESRIVRQYHFLMWKDFAAPEHPHSILNFIKRVNEAWSNMLGRAVVVHCSAGVGRTGTLVALDVLLEQLRASGHVSVYNTVVDLRKQRNFLVQSLKQYVFVYRALVEYAHFGDTEITAAKLRPALDRLRSTPPTQDKCLMEVEFDKIINSPIPETVKSTSAGLAEELRARNRSPDCLPYDKNRVILTPLPGRDFSTYINASFLQAYDNTEGFIITQDPLPNTIMDFWRMVSEHNVSTIVMLSELGDGKCPRYWDDGTIQYEHISVQYEDSESCPYYTRRQFRVTNEKNGDVTSVRQLQYQGWPTAKGHVPEVTRGLAELADAAEHTPDPPATMLVHCQLGTERSPLFVALCNLIRQLRVERRVDVSAAARAVREQRAKTIDTFLQYEFLYRAILNYAELHNLLEDS